MNMTAWEILRAEGHTLDGRCEKCWREAATLYAGGQGAYESHNSAYYAVTDRVEADAEQRASQTEAT